MASPDCPSTRSRNAAWVHVSRPNSRTQGRRLMTRALWCSLVLLTAIVALLLCKRPGRRRPRMRHTVIAASGDPAPTGGTEPSFSPSSMPGLTHGTRSRLTRSSAGLRSRPACSSETAGLRRRSHSEPARIRLFQASVRYSTHSSRQTGTSCSRERLATSSWPMAGRLLRSREVGIRCPAAAP